MSIYQVKLVMKWGYPVNFGLSDKLGFTHTSTIGRGGGLIMRDNKVTHKKSGPFWDLITIQNVDPHPHEWFTTKMLGTSL
jgi:hypothetical protein